MEATDTTEATVTTDMRQQRGLNIAAVSRITRRNGFWLVPSSTGNGNYRVHLNPPSPAIPMCNCPDYEARGQKCKHVFAVEFVVKRETGADGTETVTKSITVREKRTTYKQDWPAYNKAQTTEKARFLILLRDLCRGIVEPAPRAGRGRRPVRLSDAVFAAAFKTYSTLSARRFMTDLGDAHAKGCISQPLSFSTVTKALENPDLIPILRALIAESALPLKRVEVKFAVDSSGFTTSRVSWRDHKYGKGVPQHDWVKAHLMCGVKTNIVTSIEIGERYDHDSPQFIPLVNATAKTFAIDEVSADKAYNAAKNFEAVAALGGTAYIPFKCNATAASGGLYAKMFHYFSLNRDDYLAHYHKRSNVESTFSMVKAKFGEHIRSRTDTAMVNEALCKVLCHNICCLIQSMCELGINPVFWGEEADAMEKVEKVAKTDDIDEMMEIYAWV